MPGLHPSQADAADGIADLVGLRVSLTVTLTGSELFDKGLADGEPHHEPLTHGLPRKGLRLMLA